MLNFRFRFTRYDKHTCTRSNSWAIHEICDSFKDAHDHANALLHGMQMADPAAKFSIIEISADGHYPETDESTHHYADPFGLAPEVIK